MTSILRLIPDDPTFVPSTGAQQAAIQLLAGFLPNALAISVQVHDEITFVDQGANFESVACPACGSHWTTEWWQMAMDHWYQSHDRNLLVTAPCCGARVSLHALQYEMPAGFARFVLEARDPADDLDTGQMTVIADILGCQLRRIWAHY
jgi:hypothetical protein